MSALNRIVKYDLDAYIAFRDYPFENVARQFLMSRGFAVEVVSDVDHELFAQLVVLRQEHQPSEARGYAESYLLKKFSCGDVCYACVKDGRVVGYSWVGSDGNEMLRGVAAFLRGRRVAIVHGTYVSPVVRGNGLQVLLDAVIKNDLVGRCNEVYAFAGVRNFSSIRNRLGVNLEYRILYHLSVFFFGFLFNFYPKYSREPWRDLKKKLYPWERPAGMSEVAYFKSAAERRL